MIESSIVGVVLAGGLSRRMEGPEKSLMVLDGHPLIAHVVSRLSRQVRQVLINANGDPTRFAFTGLPVQPDTVPGFAGPLAGVLAGMRWCERYAPKVQHIMTAAADTPLFPDDLLSRFTAKLASSPNSAPAICLAQSDGNRHPVFGLWPVILADELEHFLVGEDQQKVILFAKRHVLHLVDFPLLDGENKPVDPFFNINTPQDLLEAEALMKSIRK